MLKRMPYSLWKSYYRKYPADQYDIVSKTILVELPDIKPVKAPKDWIKSGNHYFTPGGTTVTFWNTGLARNYIVERFISTYRQMSKTINPGLNSMQKVIDTVAYFESHSI